MLKKKDVRVLVNNYLIKNKKNKKNGFFFFFNPAIFIFIYDYFLKNMKIRTFFFLSHFIIC